MSRSHPSSSTVVGLRMRARRENLGYSQEKVGVAIGIDESSSRARISRYELGVHEPPVPTARLIANVLGAPLTYLYCEDDNIAELLLELNRLSSNERDKKVQQFIKLLVANE
jgi:transcriptional regulator with XRE-family HTH domain